MLDLEKFSVIVAMNIESTINVDEKYNICKYLIKLLWHWQIVTILQILNDIIVVRLKSTPIIGEFNRKA